MIRHCSPISGVDAFGSRFVATAGYDNRVILWDAATKTGVTRSFHDHLANQCRFSRCGRFLVTASSDYTARLWSIPDLGLKAVYVGHDDDVEMAVISPDLTRVATASRDHLVRIFSLSGQLQATLAGHSADVLSVEWVDDGSELLSSSDDGTIRRWCSATGRAGAVLDFHGVETDTLVTVDDRVICAGNDRGQVVVVTNGRERAYQAHEAGIKRLVYEPSNRMLLSSSYDRTIKLWNVTPDGDLSIRHIADVPPVVWLRSCAFAGDSRLVFGTFGSSYATYDLTDSSWDLDAVESTPGLNAVRVIGGVTYSVGDAGTVFADGRPMAVLASLCNFLGGWPGLVVTGGQLGILFNAETGETLHHHRSPLNCSATFRRSGADLLVVGTYTGEGLIFQRRDARLEFLETVRLFDNAVKGVASNDEVIFSVCATGDAAFHSISSLGHVRTIAAAHEKISNGAVRLADGRFASVSRDRKLRIWSSGDVVSIETPHDHSIKCVTASSEGALIATGAYDGRIAVFDASKWSWCYRDRPTASGISSICPGANWREFLASSYDGQIYRVSGAVQ